MNRFRFFCACVSLSLLQLSMSAVAQDAPDVELTLLDEAEEISLDPTPVSDCCDCQTCWFSSGWFVGIGGSYNSVRADSVFSGSGITDIYSGSQLVAVGFAGGPAAPMRETDTTFAPVVQAGYFQNIGDSEFLWGAKVSYKYLGITLAQDNFDAPQVGVYEEFNPPSTSTFTGNATTDSAQTIVDSEVAFLPFLGRDYKYGRVYFGGGPVTFDTRSKLYGLSSYADINGVHTNVGGRPLNLSGSKWLWGGAFQMGVMHYFGRSFFVDVSYDFMVTGINRFDWFVPVTSVSNGLTYDTGIHYREEIRLWAQSLNVTLNLNF